MPRTRAELGQTCWVQEGLAFLSTIFEGRGIPPHPALPHGGEHAPSERTSGEGQRSSSRGLLAWIWVFLNCSPKMSCLGVTQQPSTEVTLFPKCFPKYLRQKFSFTKTQLVTTFPLYERGHHNYDGVPEIQVPT